eukprot:1733572-Pyramimonas_sp.AAC.1
MSIRKCGARTRTAASRCRASCDSTRTCLRSSVHPGMYCITVLIHRATPYEPEGSADDVITR